MVGAGGAGFPTHVKLAGKAEDGSSSTPPSASPVSHKDKEVLRQYAPTT